MAKLTYLPAQPFGDGVYKMALGPIQIHELEYGPGIVRVEGGEMSALVRPLRAPVGGAPKRGIYEIFSTLMTGRLDMGGSTEGNPFQSRASEADIRNVVRLGLIGGGRGVVDGREVVVTEADAERLIRDYGPPHRPLNELWDVAASLAYAFLVGIDE